jgi:hypothetical protein
MHRPQLPGPHAYTRLGFAFDYIVVCTVTGSTHAGMLVGFWAIPTNTDLAGKDDGQCISGLDWPAERLRNPLNGGDDLARHPLPGWP